MPTPLQTTILKDTCSHAAVVVFCSSSQEEAQNKPIFGLEHTDLNRKLWSALKKHTLRCVELSKLDFIIADKQVGSSFGQRLSFALSDAFEMGYEKLIVLSIDNPNLTAESILDVARCLENKDWVLEPSDRGGINILGIHKENFEFDTFSMLPWQKDNLSDEFIGQARMLNQKLSILKSNPDFNELNDLKSWLDSSPQALLSLVIRGFLYKESYRLVVKG